MSDAKIEPEFYEHLEMGIENIVYGSGLSETYDFKVAGRNGYSMILDENKKGITIRMTLASKVK